MDYKPTPEERIVFQKALKLSLTKEEIQLIGEALIRNYIDNPTMEQMNEYKVKALQRRHKLLILKALQKRMPEQANLIQYKLAIVECADL